MPTYLLSIGSNIDPRRNVPRILDRLLGLAPDLVASRILETEPVGLRPEGGEPPGRFLNLAVALDWPGDAASLKLRLVAIEEALGRDRSSPERKRLSRSADLDIVGELRPGAEARSMPLESYVRPAVLELLCALGGAGDDAAGGVRSAGTQAGVALLWAGREIGRLPVRLSLTAAGGRVEEIEAAPPVTTRGPA